MKQWGVAQLLTLAVVWVLDTPAAGAWAEFLWKSSKREAEGGAPPPVPEAPAPESRPRPQPAPRGRPRDRTKRWEGMPRDERTGIAPAPGEGAPGERQPMYNLLLQPMGDWKPVWHGGLKSLQWDNRSRWYSVHVCVGGGRLDTVEDLRKAARTHPSLGNAITKVLETQRTAKGWYAVVQHDEGKATTLVYVRTLGGETVTCWGQLDRPHFAKELLPIAREDVIPLAESIRLISDAAKGEGGRVPALAPRPTIACAVKPLRRLEGHGDTVLCFALSRDGTVLVSGHRDNAVVQWDVASGKATRTLTGHTQAVGAVDIAADGRLAASGDGAGTLKLWDLASGKPQLSWEGHMKGVTSLVLAPKGDALVSASTDGTFCIWDLPGGTERSCLYMVSPNRRLAFSGDGRTLLTATMRGFIKLREWPRFLEDKCDAWVYTRRFGAAAVSSDGERIAGGGEALEGKVGHIQLHDHLGRMLTVLRGHDAPVTALAFSPDASLLASGDASGKVKLWDTEAGREVAALADGPDEVRALAFSPDGKILAKTAGNAIALWGVTARPVD